MIGLATPTNVNNYGTKLQAYAVQEIIRSLGYKTEILPLCSNQILRNAVRYFCSPRILIKTVLKKVKKQNGELSRLLDANKQRIRNSAISSIDHRKLNIIDGHYSFGKLKKMCRKYDAVVCGSDQIWNPINAICDFWALRFVPRNIRRVALAPSFGVESIPKGQVRYYRNFLKRIDSLSVREPSGARLIRELSGRDVIVLADPSLQVSKSIWDDFIRNEKAVIEEGNYIFCYFLGDNEWQRNRVTEFANVSGCKIASPIHFKKYVPADENFANYKLYDMTPEQFVKAIAEAQYVFTDSFHGTVFSILFHKRFFTFERYTLGDKESTNNRIRFLLDSLNLSDRLVRPDSIISEVCMNEPDYVLVDRIIDSMRCDAREYLQNAFSGICTGETKYVNQM